MNDIFYRKDVVQEIREDEDTTMEGRDTVDGNSNSNIDGMSMDKDNYERLLSEAQCELYQGCTEYTVLKAVVELIQYKVDGGWTNKSVDKLLGFMRKTYPKPNNIPETYYACKKMLKGLGLGYENIHACKYDCILFYKEHEWKDKCPECNEPRYKDSTSEKGKKIPQKVLRYFPLKPRLQRLFMSRNTATDM
ncbi:unnamed protein product, partial [Prunus brigantina]